MDDDFNTANGISVLFELSSLANHYLFEKNTDLDSIEAFPKTFEEIIQVFWDLSLA